MNQRPVNAIVAELLNCAGAYEPLVPTAKVYRQAYVAKLCQLVADGGGSCSLTFANKCSMYGGDFDFETCTCSGCDSCSGSPVLEILDLGKIEV